MKRRHCPGPESFSQDFLQAYSKGFLYFVRFFYILPGCLCADPLRFLRYLEHLNSHEGSIARDLTQLASVGKSV